MPGTTTMNISLPEELKAFAQRRAADKAYANPSDYVRALIREDLKRSEDERLEALLLEGLASGKAEALDLDEIKREVKARLAARSLRSEG
jgi:antitoxin ParD1/3/4